MCQLHAQSWARHSPRVSVSDELGQDREGRAQAISLFPDAPLTLRRPCPLGSAPSSSGTQAPGGPSAQAPELLPKPWSRRPPVGKPPHVPFLPQGPSFQSLLGKL